MKLSEAAKIYEECMKGTNLAPLKDCSGCPLYKFMTLDFGEKHDAHGKLTWKIQGCSMMAFFEQWLKTKKPGQPININEVKNGN